LKKGGGGGEKIFQFAINLFGKKGTEALKKGRGREKGKRKRHSSNAEERKKMPHNFIVKGAPRSVIGGEKKRGKEQ